MYSQLQEGAAETGATDEADAPDEAGPPIRPPASTAGRSAPHEKDVAPAEAALAEDAAPPVVRRPTSLDSLKTEIARAMQVAADLERERIDASVGGEETAQLEKIFARAAVEAAELSKHADEDVSLVNAWYKDQVKRIRTEADRQIDDRRTGLEQSLTHHGSLIEAEIESVHSAVQDYRTSLGAFFGRLAEERDPSAIARLAGDLPDPPDLDEVRAEARSAAMQALEQGSAAETPDPTDDDSANGSGGTGPDRELVPVMDQDATRQGGGTLDGSAAAGAMPVSSAPSAGQSSANLTQSEVDVAASPPEALAPQGNVAVRVIRALTIWTSATGDSEDQ